MLIEAYHGKHSLFGIYKRDYRVYSGKDDGSEVDFIAEKPNEKQ